MEKRSTSDARQSVIWAAFSQDPTTGVALIGVDGTIYYLNQVATNIVLAEPTDPSELIGKNLRDFGMDSGWVDERLALYKKVSDTGKPVMLRFIWNGTQLVSWYSPIPTENDGEAPRLLVTVRRSPETEDTQHALKGDHEVAESAYVVLGELADLTNRELEVLALIGQGLTSKEIASVLFRSVKTIENHRDSIGRKLNKSKGIELVRIAKQAGLKVGDADRKRIEVETQERV